MGKKKRGKRNMAARTVKNPAFWRGRESFMILIFKW